MHNFHQVHWGMHEVPLQACFKTQKRAAQPLTAVPSPCLKVLYIFNCRQKYFTIKVTSHRVSKREKECVCVSVCVYLHTCTHTRIHLGLLHSIFKHLCKTIHSNKWTIFSIMSQRQYSNILFLVTHKLGGRGRERIFLLFKWPWK